MRWVADVLAYRDPAFTMRVYAHAMREETWLIRHVASRVDPILFRATNGRLTVFGPPAMPMLALTTTGRRSGRRTVQLAYVTHEGGLRVVGRAIPQMSVYEKRTERCLRVVGLTRVAREVA